jgi:[acyl-carrier-protein] S-malonyltransferase
MYNSAFLFPGQGAQYVGMGKDFAQTYPSARAVFKKADEVLGFELSKKIFEGTEEELKKTEITQPAVLTTSVAIFTVLQERGILPGAVAGLSLGEYSALVCSGAIEFEESLHLVQQRAKYMQEAVPPGRGAMAAVMGLDPEEVQALCRQCSSGTHVEPVNYNCPGQIVVAGYKEGVEEVCRLVKESKGRAVMLSVSAPFHSKLLKPVEEKMHHLLKEIPIREPVFPFVANASARYLKNPREIRESLIKQVSSPVLWEDSMRLLLRDGHNFFIEVGPGHVLTGFMKKIARKTKMAPVENRETFGRLYELLEEVG